MISQGIFVFHGDNMLNEKWYFCMAITFAVCAFIAGAMECMRVLGKTLILDEAEKIRIALFNMEQSADAFTKELLNKINAQLRGRPDKQAIGELDFLATRLGRGEDLSKVLVDYHTLLETKVRHEYAKNPILNAWQSKGQLNDKTLLLSGFLFILHYFTIPIPRINAQ